MKETNAGLASCLSYRYPDSVSASSDILRIIIHDLAYCALQLIIPAACLTVHAAGSQFFWDL